MRQGTYGDTDLRSRAEFTWHLKYIIMVPANYAIWTCVYGKLHPRWREGRVQVG
jgi:hypothetical protein